MALPGPTSVDVSTFFASTEPFEAVSCTDDSIANTVWFKFTPDQTMEVVATTQGSNFPTFIGLYNEPRTPLAGPTGAEATECSQSYWDGARVGPVTLQAGRTYYFQVGTQGNEGGRVHFSLAESVPDP